MSFMDAITVLHHRVSQSKLALPAPDREQLDILIRAATRAADHGNLQPWRFLVIEGVGLEKLGELFARVAAEKKPDISQAELDRFKSMPLRAPMIIVAIAKCQVHPKIPKVEQLIAAGAAAQNILTASFALGLGAIWRTGDMAYDGAIKQALGLVSNEALDEQIVGFIYIGTPTGSAHLPRAINPSDFFTTWTGE
jgi:nitroreductase